MKKIIAIIALAASVFGTVSCQKEGATQKGGLHKVTITACVAADKVSINNDTEGTLSFNWAVGDVVYDFTTKTPFVATEVNSETGKATLEGYAASGQVLHLVYERNYVPDSQEHFVSFEGQLGLKNSPVVFFAHAVVQGDTAEGMFDCANANLGIIKAKGLSQSSAIKTVIIEGDNLKEGEIKYNSGIFSFPATTEEGTSLTVNLADNRAVTNGATGDLADPIFITLPAGAKVSGVKLVTTMNKTYKYSISKKELLTGSYSYINGQEFTLVD